MFSFLILSFLVSFKGKLKILISSPTSSVSMSLNHTTSMLSPLFFKPLLSLFLGRKLQEVLLLLQASICSHRHFCFLSHFFSSFLYFPLAVSPLSLTEWSRHHRWPPLLDVSTAKEITPRARVLVSHPHSLTCTRAGIAWSSDADKLAKALGIRESPSGKRARWDLCVCMCVCVCLFGGSEVNFRFNHRAIQRG